MKNSLSQRGLRVGACLLLGLLSTLPAHARSRHSESWARGRFATAERMREALNGRPTSERSRRDYQRVINVYRGVYFGAPSSTKADPSAVAVAEILVEMGRRFDDDKILNGAISQYKFLRREYPGSKYRFDALFTIGEIYKDDLNDPDRARSTFQEFLHSYPHNRLTDDARQAIADLDREALAASAKKKETPRSSNKAAPVLAGSKSASKSVSKSDSESSAKTDSASGLGAESDSSQSHAAPDERSPVRTARVTGIRHWSTPDYTRVAIDVESEVKFASQRIAHPDRIFFDLKDTRLASTLVGKSFDVDDGFLKKIRVAQYQPGRTRVVLEIDSLSDYEAFLLPDPYRLIVDIHGKNDHGKSDLAKRARAKIESSIATADEQNDSEPGARTDATASLQELKSEIDSVTKSEIKAEAGKAPVTSMDVSDDAKVSAKDGRDTSGSATSPRPVRSATGKSPPPPVKKVVEADDEDSDAAQSQLAKNSVSPDTSATKQGARSLASSLRPASGKRGAARADLDAREAKPTAAGDRSLIRALGLKIGRIVIDPGHGGHDTGTIGPGGLEEKDLVLEVGKRLGKMLETRLGAQVVYTRKNDTFIPLETRTAIANQERADLFISIHANSSHDPAARGVETYYLNFTSSPEALEVAARENAVSEKSIYELQDLVKKIALKDKIEESREFAGDVQESLHHGLAAKSPAIRDRGVKKAPFIVLIGANMPSILAEISFVSNPTDERRLETAEYRQRIAESLYRGIAKYVNGLSGVKVASKIEATPGQ